MAGLETDCIIERLRCWSGAADHSAVEAALGRHFGARPRKKAGRMSARRLLSCVQEVVDRVRCDQVVFA